MLTYLTRYVGAVIVVGLAGIGAREVLDTVFTWKAAYDKQ